MVVNAPRGSEKCGEGGSREISWCSRADRIDWWASCNKMERSSGVNSFCVAELQFAPGVAVKFSGCGDIALPPTAEDKRAAAALHHLPVNLRPEGDEVIARRYQRQQNHEPYRHPRDPVHREEIPAIDGPFFPAMLQNNGHHGNDLHQHLELTQVASLDGKSLRSRNRPQSA